MKKNRVAVLHIALNPVTGPWSVMRDLANEQQKSDLYVAVGIGVISYSDWPNACLIEAQRFGKDFFQHKTLRCPGTFSFLLQTIIKPPIAKWALDFSERHEADTLILHFHNAWLSGVFLPSIEVLMGKIKIVATFHGVNESFAGKPLRKIIHRWIARKLIRPDIALTSVDSKNLERCQNIFGIPSTRFKVVHNGVLPPNHRNRLNPHLSPSKPLRIAHMSSLLPEKGWKITAEACSQLVKRGENIQLHIAGNGPDKDEVSSFCAENSTWAYYHGFVSNPKENFLPNIDLMVLMSSWEGLPMAIIEAMACGIPTIATNVGGVSEATINNQTGLLIDRDINDLTRAIVTVLENPELISIWGRNCIEHYDRYFSLPNICKAYHSVYLS